MSDAVSTIVHTRGETITFALRASHFDGTETVKSDLKKAINKSRIPEKSSEVLFTITPTFVAADGDKMAEYHFQISSEQSLNLEASNYILDAKITKDGLVDKTNAIGLTLNECVTE